MTIDNDTGVAIVRSPAEVLDSYRCDSPATDLAIMGQAIEEAAKDLKTYARKQQFDAMAGAAQRLDRYAGKANQLAQDISNGRATKGSR